MTQQSSSDSVRIRHYRRGDARALVALWNRSLPQDPITLELFTRRVFCDANFDPEGLLVAERIPAPDGGTRRGEAGEEAPNLAGFMLVLARRVPLWGDDLEPEHAWITAFAVDPSLRRQGIGRALWRAAQGFARARGRRCISFAPYAPHYFLPGIDRTAYPSGAAFLDRLGFRPLYQAVAMDRSLVGYQVPEEVQALARRREAEGYRFLPLEPDRLAETIRLAHEEFNPDWGRALRESFLQGVPLEQTLIATDPSGRVVGFAMFGAYDHVKERFGPFGVDASQRGKGLGKILLHLTMERMRARGLHSAWFLWTEETTAAGHLYLQAGYRITRRFDVMRCELEETEAGA